MTNTIKIKEQNEINIFQFDKKLCDGFYEVKDNFKSGKNCDLFNKHFINLVAEEDSKFGFWTYDLNAYTLLTIQYYEDIHSQYLISKNSKIEMVLKIDSMEIPREIKDYLLGYM